MSTRIEKNGFGLLANGSGGRWHVAIDEATSGPDRWRAQIEGPFIYVDFELPSLDVVGNMIRLLESKTGQSVVIGKSTSIPVILVRDNEFEDRFFLKIGTTNGVFVDIVIAGKDVENLAIAMRQVQEELQDEM